MSESLGDAVLTLRTDGTGLQTGMRQGESITRSSMARMRGSIASTGAAFRNLGSSLTLGLTVPAALAARAFVGEMQDIDAQNARTESFLARVGDKSMTTADGIRKLAGAIQAKTGIDDQAVQSAQNSILWLSQLNVTTAKGARTFDLASRATANWAEATGKPIESLGPLMAKSMAQAAAGTLLLPKGVKLGAAATERLKKTIEGTGSAASKQSALVKALAKNFAGAARLTDTDKWNNAMDGLMGSGAELMRTLTPLFNKFVGYVTMLTAKFQTLSPNMQQIVAKGLLLAVALGPIMTIVSAVGAAIGLLATPVGAIVVGLAVLAAWWLRSGTNMEKFKRIVAQVATYVRNVAWPAIVDGAKKALAWYKSNLAPAINNVVANIRATFSQWFTWASAAWAKWGKDITAFAVANLKPLVAKVKAIIKLLAAAISAVMAVLRGDWKEAWAQVKEIGAQQVALVVATIKGFIPGLSAVAKALWAVIVFMIKTELATLGSVASGLVRLAIDAVSALASWAADAARSVGTAIVNGIVQGIKDGAGAIADAARGAAQGALDAAKNLLKIKSPSGVFRDEVGLQMIRGIAAGIDLGADGMIETLEKVMDKATNVASIAASKASRALDRFRNTAQVVKDRRAEVQELHRTAKDRVLDARMAVQQAAQGVRDARGKGHTKLDREHAARQLALANAQLAVERTAEARARARLNAAVRANAASRAALVQANQASRAALRAQQLAAAALAKADAKRERMSAALEAINDVAALALAKDDFMDALAGAPQADAMLDRLAVLKKQYADLQAYLKANMADLSTAQQAEIVGQVTDLVNRINEASTSYAKMTGSTSTTGATSGGAGGASGSAAVQLVQQFASTPDMFAASRSALFEFQRIGLVGG